MISDEEREQVWLEGWNARGKADYRAVYLVHPSHKPGEREAQERFQAMVVQALSIVRPPSVEPRRPVPPKLDVTEQLARITEDWRPPASAREFAAAEKEVIRFTPPPDVVPLEEDDA